ncbi:MAG TPA: fimbria/pilus outer membrane usher protein [Burkholderiaceae bacterium]|nr:fimbria/pilus outer membrane usher protein [Burkholderiaceae bacterium]
MPAHICAALLVAAGALAGRSALASTEAPPSPPTGSAATPTAAPAPGDGERPGTRLEDVLLEVTVNGVPQGTAVVFKRSAAGELFVNLDDLVAWRLRRLAEQLDAQAQRIDGARFVPLAALGAQSATLDATRLTLTLTLPAEAFDATALSAGARQRLLPTPPSPGAFLNYDLSATRSRAQALADRAVSSSSAVLSTDAAIFGPWGALNSQQLLSKLPERDSRLVRLETHFVRDFPEQLASLRVGDAISGAGLTRPVRFGGLQFASNFATDPTLVTAPLLQLGGSATLPSTVDVFVNNALTRSQTVPAGPFSISGIPTISGAGTVTVIVRDLLGRETILTQPFVASASLLAPGLQSYSAELGALRLGYGERSNAYGSAFASGSWRRGLSNTLTAELGGELSARHRLAAGGLVGLVGSWGVATAQLAASSADGRGSGSQTSVSLSTSQLTAARLGLGVRYRQTSQAFVSLATLNPPPGGLSLASLQARHELDASASVSLGGRGSLAAAWIRSTPFDRSRSDTTVRSLTYSQPVGRRAFVGVSLQHVAQACGAQQSVTCSSRSASAFLSLPLDAGWTTSANAQDAAGRRELSLRAQRAPEGRLGASGAIEASDRGLLRAESRYEAERIGLSLDAERRPGSQAVRAGVRGSLAWLGGEWIVSRSLGDAFAVVTVPDSPGARIYANNLPAGRTDARGRIVVPNLLPYNRNEIAVEQLDLSMDMEIRSLKLDVVPYTRSGVALSMPVRRLSPATGQIVDPQDQPLAPGTELRALPGGQPVALGQAGRVFVNDSSGMQAIEARAGTQLLCRASVPEVTATDGIKDWGRLRCMPVER